MAKKELDLIDAGEASKRLGMHKESFLRALRRETIDLTIYEKTVPHAARKFFFDAHEIKEELEVRKLK